MGETQLDSYGWYFIVICFFCRWVNYLWIFFSIASVIGYLMNFCYCKTEWVLWCCANLSVGGAFDPVETLLNHTISPEINMIGPCKIFYNLQNKCFGRLPLLNKVWGNHLDPPLLHSLVGGHALRLFEVTVKRPVGLGSVCQYLEGFPIDSQKVSWMHFKEQMRWVQTRNGMVYFTIEICNNLSDVMALTSFKTWLKGIREGSFPVRQGQAAKCFTLGTLLGNTMF